MKLRNLSLAFAICLAMFSASVFAADGSSFDNRFYIAPMASYGFFHENTYHPDDQVGVQLDIGKPLTRFLTAELYGFYYNGVDTPTWGPDANANVWGAGASFLLFPIQLFPIHANLPIRPYAVVGGGAGEVHFHSRTSGPPTIGEQFSTFYDFGAGFLIPVTDSVDIRAEYRYRHNRIDAVTPGYYVQRGDIVSIGFQMALGAKPMPVEATTAAPPPPPQKVQPKDSDGDGVIDQWDQCANTPANTAVDNHGCPVKTSSNQGSSPLVIRGLLFGFDSDHLSSQNKSVLDGALDQLTSSNSSFDVNGNTDSKGSKAYNKRLSIERAETVKNYLVDHGVDAARLQTHGFGATRPVAPNTKPDGSDNPAGRAKNRRVEIHQQQ